MSHRPDLENYSAQAAHVFTTENLSLSQSDVNGAFRELQKTYKSYIRSWWEITSLQTYIQNKIVYRGLRINLSPSNHLENPEFVQGWQNILTESSLKLLDYLLEWEKKYFQVAGAKLEKDIADIQTFRAQTEFSNLESKLQKHIEQFQSEIKDRKHKKFVRDKNDFVTKQIYRQPQPNPYTRKPEYTDLSESEYSSTDERAPKNQYDYRRKFKNKRGISYRRSYPRRPYAANNRETWRPTEQPGERGNPINHSEWPPLCSVPSSAIQGGTSHLLGPNPIMSIPPTMAPPPPQPTVFLGMSGMELRDRERWGYQQYKPA